LAPCLLTLSHGRIESTLRLGDLLVSDVETAFRKFRDNFTTESSSPTPLGSSGIGGGQTADPLGITLVGALAF